MNNKELIDNLYKVINEKNYIITALVENSKSQTITSEVLLKKLKKSQSELDNIKSINLN